MEPKEQAAQFPEKRGVYMFKGGVDQVIYVGKVRSLRNRDKNQNAGRLFALSRSFTGLAGNRRRHE
jgi:excinuclease UvrABC nuclease subunit